MCRIVAPLAMLVVVANTLPMLWAMLEANPTTLDQLCRSTQGCSRAYLCPSSQGTFLGWNHPALCLEGPFTNQEVDAAAWRPWVLQALPTPVRGLMPSVVTVRWTLGGR